MALGHVLRRKSLDGGGAPPRVLIYRVDELVQAVPPRRHAQQQSAAARPTQRGTRLEEARRDRARRVDEVRAEDDVKSIGQVRRGPVEASYLRVWGVRADDVQQTFFGVRRENDRPQVTADSCHQPNTAAKIICT